MSDVPEWVERLRNGVAAVAGDQSLWVPQPPPNARDAAVLVLVAETPDGPNVVLLERASTLRNHAGQMAFPGGAIDSGDCDATGAALREASEEVGLRVATVQILGSLAPIWVPPSNFSVTPVIAYWRRPHPLSALDTEVVHIARVGMSALANPQHRYRVKLSSGNFGPAFAMNGDLSKRLIWGFTAGVLDLIVKLGGWYRPWDRTRVLPMPQVS